MFSIRCGIGTEMKKEKEYLLKYLKRVAVEIEEMHKTFSASIDRSGADWELVVKFREEEKDG